MAKTVKIPDDTTRFEVIINNRIYSYKGGAEVEVPDEVAALIEQYTAAIPKAEEYHEVTEFEWAEY